MFTVVPNWFTKVIGFWKDGLIDDITYINAYNWLDVMFVYVDGFV